MGFSVCLPPMGSGVVTGNGLVTRTVRSSGLGSVLCSLPVAPVYRAGWDTVALVPGWM